MKKTKYLSFIYLLVVLMLPCIITYFLYDQWFPFRLAGKQFLIFFIMYMGLGYGIIFFDKMMQRHKPDQKINVGNALIGLTIILSLSRIIQGLYHHKPIIYLILLSMIHMIILVMVNSLNRKTYPKKNGDL